jgi:methylenetetrahydrofolate dehydrogenase (NADP+)/methenyltetrahydrofolate cyclohydrolase/formyltetrahydrofolate synthetase
MKLDPTQMADWQIAEAAEQNIKPIQQIGEKLGLQEGELIPMGRGVAKIDYTSTWQRLKDAPIGKYVDVTAITPTPLGE